MPKQSITHHDLCCILLKEKIFHIQTTVSHTCRLSFTKVEIPIDFKGKGFKVLRVVSDILKTYDVSYFPDRSFRMIELQVK